MFDPRGLARGLVKAGYRELPMTSAHAVTLEMIPPLYKDPFDRLLAAQALAEQINLVTAEQALFDDPGSIIPV